MPEYIVAHQYVTWVIENDEADIQTENFDRVPIEMLVNLLEDGAASVHRQTRLVYAIDPNPSLYDMATEKHLRFFEEDNS